MPTATTSPVIKAIVLGTLIGGSLDIAEAFIYSSIFGHGPAGVLRGIASGIAGEQAFSASRSYLVLGLLIHFFIALSWTALFVLLARRVTYMLQQPLVAGVVYGVVIYGVMNFIVLPLAGFTKHRHFTLFSTANAVLALVCCMGIPLAYVTRAVMKRAGEQLTA